MYAEENLRVIGTKWSGKDYHNETAAWFDYAHHRPGSVSSAENIGTSEKKILPRIGSLIESPGFYPNLTGTENLKIFAELRGIKKQKTIQSTLELVGLPYLDRKLYSQYSLGMKQRLAIALSVMHNPELLILDEPINGLDPIGIAEIRSFIRVSVIHMEKLYCFQSHSF